MLVKRGSKAGTLMRELPIGKRTKRGLPADVAVSWMAEHGRAWKGGGARNAPLSDEIPLGEVGSGRECGEAPWANLPRASRAVHGAYRRGRWLCQR